MFHQHPLYETLVQGEKEGKNYKYDKFYNAIRKEKKKCRIKEEHYAQLLKIPLASKSIIVTSLFNFKNWNLVLLSRILWDFHYKKDSLWVR